MKQKYKKYQRLISTLLMVPMSLLFLFSGGCTMGRMAGEIFAIGDGSLELRDIDIDEREVESIRIQEEEMEKSYDISKDISSIADDLENPYKPFFETGGEEQSEKNIIIVESIYSKDGSDFAEIKFNDYVYLLTVDDTFLDIYSVKAINETSVVLLKGDEVINIFINEPVYD